MLGSTGRGMPHQQLTGGEVGHGRGGEHGCAPGLGPCAIKVTPATVLGKSSSPNLCSCLPQPPTAARP